MTFHILDACCGSRMFWFEKENEDCVFMDKRCETLPIDIGTPGTKGRSPIRVSPNLIADFTSIPFANESFSLVVFDPPHLTKLGTSGIIAKKYGRLFPGWEVEIQEGFVECFRVLKPNGILIFKWSSVEIKISKVLQLAQKTPLFGHNSGKNRNTHWFTFIKTT